MTLCGSRCANYGVPRKNFDDIDDSTELDADDEKSVSVRVTEDINPVLFSLAIQCTESFLV